MVMQPTTKPAARNPRRDASRADRVSKHDASATVLACNYCRSKKVKCMVEPEGCKRCKKLNIECTWPNGDQRKCPSSKGHIKELYDRIAYLEAALEAATANQSPLQHLEAPKSRTGSMSSASPCSIPAGEGDNIISRLCGRQWKLNSDHDGQYKFFGPTSSLHLTESVSSSLLGPFPQTSRTEDRTLDGLVDPAIQDHLLDIYWRFQHSVLQVFDREEFLEGMRTGQSKYFSKALLCAVYACAARISNRPEVRAMVNASDDDLEDEQPFLVVTATLLLLSVIYCSSSQDTKGWLLVGDACRLAIDFGLHSVSEQLASTKLSPTDFKVRRITYLGCLVFDRLWALYLGRPFCLQSDGSDLEAHYAPQFDEPWELRISFSWARLLIIVGRICEALNNERCSSESLEDLDRQLQDWQHSLELDLQYQAGAHASVLLLHMQYYSSKIILHRPTAGFGSIMSQPGASSNTSRQICLYNAISIANALQDYRITYGDATTLSGVGLHTIATASTILIADIAERRSPDASLHVTALKTCVLSLSELEKTYMVARRVRRIIRLVMGLCHLDIDNIEAQPKADFNAQKSSDFPDAEGDLTFATDSTPFGNDGGDLSNISWSDFFFTDTSLPGSAQQFDIIYSLDY
ncbi:fungal-specific transcription factor domain-containing protein [Lophiotrema nucula]|uniref:Fungal-specific transcription factor domain-containing protein n=1 Tax=Lophiotrema nucula TaxID=690887 RepID=A0A6A5Z752_9PLEO|nr:fungal-specific transcription factor domain-containing protein [Lophiotrema nucula]